MATVDVSPSRAVPQPSDQIPAPTTPDAGTAVAPRACRACSASMQADQDWCLSCGTAAPGRLGGRPGWQTVNAVAALTLVLVTGAVAASYAALSGDASSEAGRQAPANVAPVPGQVAQVPDAPVPVPTVPPATALTPGTTAAGAPKLPVLPGAVPSVPGSTSPRPFVMPSVPATPVVPVTPTAPKAPAADEKPTADGKPADDEKPTATGDEEPASPPVALTKIELGPGALGKYDPAKRSVRSTDPANASDGKRTTSWSVTTPEDKFPMQVGLLVDLKTAKTVRQLELGTTTPGGRVEIYGAVGSALPPDILDTRWEHAASRSRVDETSDFGNVKDDKQELIRLRRSGSKFRYVLVWFTTPPRASKTVLVTELELRG